jgi:lipoprotein-releasing system ATP-binding protein
MDKRDDSLNENSVETGSPEKVLTATGLCKSFRSAQSTIDVLEDLNFELNAGETLAVVGASGIGKSTLLHILGTLDYPDKGKLYYKGTNVFSYDDHHMARFRNETMGFVFQFHHLLPEFTALENTMIPALIQGLEKGRARQLAETILIRVGLTNQLHQKVPELSGGEQQRVALARALVLKPAILLADEPTGNLDKSNSEQVHHLLLELNREMGMSIVVVTHNMELANCMERRATISKGRMKYLDAT